MAFTMGLPLYYAIGREAAFSAADNYRANWPDVDITGQDVMMASYAVVVETDSAGAGGPDQYAECPGQLTPADPEWAEFVEGYGDALVELGVGGAAGPAR